MLPSLNRIPQVEQYDLIILMIFNQHFEGDIATNYSDRLSLATDNSVYQQLPQAILFRKLLLI